MNNDGIADLIWENSNSGKVVAWFMDSNGTTESQVELLDKSKWEIKEITDMDNDGIADLIWQNSNTGHVIVWLMDINGTKKYSLKALKHTKL